MNNWQITSYTAIGTVVIALITVLLNLYEKSKKLRFERFKLAKELIEDIYDYEYSSKALKMIDENKIADIQEAFKLSPIICDTKNDRIRDCFDSLFYSLEHIAYAIEIKIIRFEDINFGYYAKVMSKDKDLYIRYADYRY